MKAIRICIKAIIYAFIIIYAQYLCMHDYLLDIIHAFILHYICIHENHYLCTFISNYILTLA